METIDTTAVDPAIVADIDSERRAAPFCIDSIERAEWLLRKLANIAAEKARIKAQAALMIAQLGADAAQLEHRFGSELETFVKAELARRGGKRKSLTLLQGTCAFRTVTGGLTISDQVAAVKAARETAPDLFTVHTVEDFDADGYLALAEAAKADSGELLPGVDTVPDRESFSIRFGKE